MKINLDAKILDFDGNSVKFNGEDSTIGKVIKFCLRKSSSENYERKISLWKSIKDEEGVVEMKSEDVSFIKGVIKTFNFDAEAMYQLEQTLEDVDEELIEVTDDPIEDSE